MIVFVTRVVFALTALFVFGYLILRQRADKTAGSLPDLQKYNQNLLNHLAPEVRADLQAGQRQRVIAVSIFLIVMPIALSLAIAARFSLDFAFGTFGAIGTVCFGVWLGIVARNWWRRRQAGNVLVDLSPHPMRRTIERNNLSVFGIMAICFAISMRSTNSPSGWLFWTGEVLGFIVMSGLILTYSDRVSLRTRGVFMVGMLYDWAGLDRVSWSDDGRAVALRRKSSWFPHRWLVIPVPEGMRDSTTAALAQVLPSNVSAV
jgi:hypothetical protein